MTTKQFNIPHKLDTLNGLMSSFRAFCEECSLEQKVSLELQLVLEELVVNIINHGSVEEQEAKIDISLAVNDSIFTLDVADRASMFNPLTHETQKQALPFEELELGGLGIVLIKNVMDSIEYQYIDGQNRIKLTKQLMHPQ